MKVERLWTFLVRMICLLEVAAVVVPAARAQVVVATGTVTLEVKVDLTGVAGSAKGTIDPFGDVSAATGSNIATFTVLSGAPSLVGDSFQAQFALTDECSVTGAIIGGTGVFANSSGSLSVTGSPCLLTPDVTSFRITGSGSITLTITVDESCQANSDGPVQTECNNQGVKIDPPIVGTPFELHYQSERVPGRNGTSAFLTNFAHDLGGWTLDVQHAYDPVSGNLYLGTGGRRRAAVLGSPPVVNGNYLVTDQTGSEVYVFDKVGRHLRTLHALTGAAIYQFGYDANGHLTTITDSAGNVTTIRRDSKGNPSAIVAPYGQRTTITVNSDGYVTQILNPNQESIKLAFGAVGLVSSFTDALGNIDKF